MRYFVTILLVLICSYSFGQADAGVDKIIYISQTSTTTLTGSGSGTATWADISTDNHYGVTTITNPNSLVTTVTGFKQGTYYFELSVVNGGTTTKDTVVVRADRFLPPSLNLLRKLPMDSMANVANDRSGDTTNYEGSSKQLYSNGSNIVYVDRDRKNESMVDSSRGKFYASVEDGYGGWVGAGGRYSRAELSFGSFYKIDSNKTYVFEWKGYYPQSVQSNFFVKNPVFPSLYSSVVSMWQLHGSGVLSPPFSVNLKGDFGYSLVFTDYLDYLNGGAEPKTIITTQITPIVDSVLMKTNTLRIIMRQGTGYPGQKAFVKVYWNDALKYSRDTGQIGQTFQADYLKFGSIYDNRNSLTNPDSLTRGKKFSLVTEAFNVYEVPEGYEFIPNPEPPSGPVVNVGYDRTIQVPVNSLSLEANVIVTDSILSMGWTKVSGPSVTLSQTGYTASLTNLISGTYVFRFTVVQNDDKTAFDEVIVNVLPPNNGSSIWQVSVPVRVSNN